MRKFRNLPVEMDFRRYDALRRAYKGSRVAHKIGDEPANQIVVTFGKSPIEMIFFPST
jgi:hypothetical protein